MTLWPASEVHYVRASSEKGGERRSRNVGAEWMEGWNMEGRKARIAAAAAAAVGGGDADGAAVADRANPTLLVLKNGRFNLCQPL